MGKKSLMVVLAASMVLPLSGCWEERACSEGSYPVTSDSGPGETCVRSGDPIPSGYVTYPPGHTPTGRNP